MHIANIFIRYVHMQSLKVISSNSSLYKLLLIEKIAKSFRKFYLIQFNRHNRKNSNIWPSLNISDTQREISGIQREISGIQREISGLQREISGMQREISGIQREISDIQRVNVLKSVLYSSLTFHRNSSVL